MKYDILIFLGTGAAIILIGLIIYKGKAHNLISGNEIFKWAGADMNKFAKIFFNGSIYMGISIALVPTIFLIVGLEQFAIRSLPVIVFTGIIYIIIFGLIQSKKS